MFEQKQVPANLYLSAKTSLTLSDIPAYADSIIPKLYEEAEALCLDITGASEFIYMGSDGCEDTVFELLIVLPIKARREQPVAFSYFESAPFTCACLDYRGSMADIGTGWGRLMDSVMQSGLSVTDQCREVYTTWLGFDSEENITELQVGVI